MNKKILIGVAALAVLAAALLLRRCGQGPRVEEPAPQPVSVPVEPEPVVSSATTVVPVLPPVPEPVKTPIKTAAKPKPAPAPAPMAPPPVKIFPELIPKDIEIVRVYYAQMITGPSSSIEFDINGSGFTKEFEKMITVESGQPEASVKNLALVTPNQIHGRLEITDKTATMVSFPRVLIKDKVVFQAPEPFATIRPGEVLNLVFTEMGESGRTGRFRVFTNLDQEMFSNFKITVSTPTIQITDLTPAFPFVVDGTIVIGPAVGGEYDIDITLKGKNILHKPGIIRVVRPNVGQSGLIQKISALDGFHRPGDKVLIAVQGSGFSPDDVTVLSAEVAGLTLRRSSFTYVSPGRLELEMVLPAEAPVSHYGIKIKSGAEVLQELGDAFEVVPPNWTRLLKLDPALIPGGEAMVTLVGRDLGKDFISKIKVDLDEPSMKVSGFTWKSPQEATALMAADSEVKPGDYLLKITSDGKPVTPEFGSIIRVSSR